GRDGGITALKIAGILILVMFVTTLGVFAYFRKDLKSITDISGSNLGGSISYYDSSGQTLLWQDYNAVKRVPVTNSKDISPYIKDATVAIEDKDFYNHRGFDVRGIARAAYVDIAHRSSSQGGSTITQQLVKLTQDFNQERSIALKVKELILAVELERTYTKDDILRSYLNAAPYGSVDYGVQAAANDYFHTSAKDLTLAQASFLAAIPKSPSYYSSYSPYFDQKEFLARQHYVLDQMVSIGKITQKQADEAKKVDVLAQVQPQQTKYAGIKAPYFVLAARDELNKKRSGSTSKVGGWKVTTTLDMNLQTHAEETVQKNLSNITRYGADESALVVEDVKTGQMKALVGGTDFTNEDHGELNYAHDVKISPGSSFKPYDYVSFIDGNTNVGAGSVLYDSQGPLPGYLCTNKTLPPPRGQGNCLQDYDFKYPGALTLRYALGGSRNVPAVKAMLSSVPNDTSPEKVNSVNKTIDTADALMAQPNAYKCYKPGTDVNQATTADEDQCHGASAIGDGAYLHLDDHVNGIASLARMGSAIPHTYILKIDNASNKTIYTWKQPKGTQVVRQQSAYILNNMASDSKASYLAGSTKWHNYKGWTNAVKTGTTNDGFDGLMMGWNTQYAVGSWVGYHTRNKALTTFMENLTTPLTRNMMQYALDSLNTTPVNWTEPAGIQHLPAYVVRTHVGVGSVEPSASTDIFPSWYKQKSGSSSNATIDKVTNKLATSCTPESAKQSLSGNAAPNSYSVDNFYPPGAGSANSSSANTGASDDVHKCGDSPPTINLTVDDHGGNSYTVTAFVSAGTHPFNDPAYPQFPGTVTFSLGGNVIHTESVGDPQANISFDYTATSGGTITATVTDSVLYGASDSKDINFTAAVVGPLKIDTASTTSASWSGGQPGTTYTLTRTDNNQVLCTTTATSCGYGPVPNNRPIKLTDSSGDSPDTSHT
ncbi:penicillin-binding protein, partial [Candidatus Saccharibacteria bacterium]|nr:penicillin-binding protein [Candidatus Saccharibacteria bacterium]